MDDEFSILDDIEGMKERKNLRTILNRGRLNKFELDDFLSGDSAASDDE